MATLCLISLLLSLIFIIITHPTAIPINNAGFESDEPNCPPNYYWYYSDRWATGWTLYNPHNLKTDTWDVIIANPQGGDAMNDVTYGDSAPEGNCVVVILPDSDEGSGEFGIEQTLSATLAPHTSYTLTAKVGNPGSNCWSGGTDGDYCYNKGYMGWPGYIMQLLAGDDILAEDDNTIYVDDYNWATTTVQFETTSYHSQLGNPLKIRLLQKNHQETGGWLVFYDDVILDASPAPTVNPTANPSTDPSSSPSPNPSISPTIFPTDAPTKQQHAPTQPKAGPTRNPTNNPTMTPTDIPTKNPTQGPTITTSKKPTDGAISATKPTNAPTLSPSQTTETTDGKTRAGEDNNDFSVQNNLFSPMYLTLYGIGGSIVCLIGCLCVAMFCLLKRHKRVKEARGLSKQVSIRHTTSSKQVNIITHTVSEREGASRNTGNVTAEPYLQKVDNVALAYGGNAVNAYGLYQNSAAVDVPNNMGDDDDDDDDVLAYIDTAGGVGSECIVRDAPPALLPTNGAGGNRKRIPPPPPPPNMNDVDCIGSESEEGDGDIVLDDIMYQTNGGDVILDDNENNMIWSDVLKHDFVVQGDDEVIEEKYKH